MVPKPQSAETPSKIDARADSDRTFVIAPENQDLFVRTGQQIIAHCQLGISVELWLIEIGALAERAREWCQQRPAVRSCYCAPRGARVIFFVAPVAESFDFDLADAMALFTLDLLKSFNVGAIELLQVPWDNFDRFIDPETAQHVYGEPYQQPQSVDA